MSLDKNKLIALLTTTIELIQADRLRANDIRDLTVDQVLDLAEKMSAEAVEKAGKLAGSGE